MSNQPGTYVKGDRVKVAKSPSDAVALTFDGYKRVEDEQPAAETASEPASDDNDGSGDDYRYSY